MKWHLPKTSLLAFGLATLLVSVNIALSVVAYRNTVKLVASVDLASAQHKALKAVAGILQLLADAEVGERSYLITGEERYLEPYHAAVASIGARLELLKSVGASVDAQNFNSLIALVNTKIGELNESIILRKKSGFEAAAKAMAIGKAKAPMDVIRHLIGEIELQEQDLLNQSSLAARMSSRDTYILFAASALTNLFLLTLIFYAAYRDLSQRAQDQRALKDLGEKLENGTRLLQQQEHEKLVLGQMSGVLQSCMNVKEAYNAIAQFGKRLFPGEAGVFFVMHDSREYLEAGATWGEPEIGGPLFAPQECWALRRGRLHLVDDPRVGLQCDHVKAAGVPQLFYMCVPMVVHSETVGLLHLQLDMDSVRGEPAQRVDKLQQLAATFADQVALAVTNLRLRETLRQQSIHDPLTGLHNRRYLQEVMQRELARTERKKTMLAVIVLDVDYFKRFNDTYGHEAGDAVLRSLAHLIERQIRGSDIACRYGGEEFILVLPEASLSIARQRGELLREAALRMHVTLNGQTLGPVSISLGLALFPQHGATAEELIQAADAALYRAKQAGRNRLMIAEETSKAT
ncbi:MAG TPA: diguanylate cyclase [Burkholderiales bacterium]|nr:diguanylate cyclase [Burkholderiales bacterium]